MRASLKLLVRAGLLLAINGAAALCVIWIHDARLEYAPWESDAILPSMPRNGEFRAAILGTSRAYLLSRFRLHHEMIEDAFGGPVMNMALPSGGGVVPAQLYLDTFFDRNNEADQVLYFLDAFVFYSLPANYLHKFVYDEAFAPGMLWNMLTHGYPIRRAAAYVQSKLRFSWWAQKPEYMGGHTYHIPEGLLYDAGEYEHLVRQREQSLYTEGMDQAAFAQLTRAFEAVAQRCKDEGVPLYIVHAPTLLGVEPGFQQMTDWLDGIQGKYGFERLDLSQEMRDPTLFYNLDHLNTGGVRVLCRDHLSPWLAKQAESTP